MICIVMYLVVGLLGLSGPSVALSAPTPASAVPAAVWHDMPFVIGAPGRLDMDGDRRHPRRIRNLDSAVHAYADIEEVVDGTWLAHELEHYARRAVDCAGYDRRWCRHELRTVGGSRVIFVAAGARAEIIWPARGKTAVRLGWKRLVTTPVGSMTLDDPPNDFAHALLHEFPSQLRHRTWNADGGDDWRAAEEARLRYYAEQVLAALDSVDVEAHRRHAAQFIEENLARIAALRPVVDAPSAQSLGDTGTDGDLSPPLSLPFADLYGHQSRPEPPWCSAQTLIANIGEP